ncbi:MAG: GNAT family N-acetyltransferase [Deltaproteobacteria bacterium]|nr:GNAT family N-acetyltransferase [Myxococcales bacterium]MDP3213451.1 GNAT family N-acetyltransferase [Deltaproteobacteria bacterium]
MALIDAVTLAEKLRPPRALTAVGASLFAAPAPGSTAAWMAWWSGAADELAEVTARALAAGATRLVAGGPPGNYVESGVDAADVERVAALTGHGFTVRGEHVDLQVRTDVAPRAAPGVTVARCDDDVDETIRAAFGDGWAWESARAREHGGLFTARGDDGGVLGFAAHSGNLCHRGTFGPIGVLPAARGRGVGAALSRVVLADLRARGFVEATVPWVAAETVGFYGSMVTITARTRRLTLARALSGTGWP